MRKFIGKFLAAGLCVAMALSSVTVKADSVDQKYLALGADLTASQKKKVLELLDLDDNSDYKVITVTNKDEHEYLDSYLSSRVIGTRALSSVTVEQKDDGNGVNVTTQNISYCTSGMYRNALITAGIKNADVKVAGPFKIFWNSSIGWRYESLRRNDRKEDSRKEQRCSDRRVDHNGRSCGKYRF